MKRLIMMLGLIFLISSTACHKSGEDDTPVFFIPQWSGWNVLSGHFLFTQKYANQDVHELVSAYPDGSGWTVLATDGGGKDGAGAEWSPTGNHLAYVTRNSGELKILDASGHPVFSTQKADSGFAWSPDGATLVFCNAGDGIYTYTLGAAFAMKIHQSIPLTLDHEPRFSPDGQQVAFVHHDLGYFYDIRVMDKNGANVKTLTSGESSLLYFNDDLQLRWFPDGKSLLYRLRFGLLENDADEGIYTVDASSGIRYRRTVDHADLMELKPDGDLILFERDRHFFAVNTQTWYTVEVLNLSLIFDAMEDIAWSPVGEAFAVFTEEEILVKDLSTGLYGWVIRFDNLVGDTDGAGRHGSFDWGI